MPCELVTFFSSGVGRMAVVDSQIESYNAIAVEYGAICVGRRACGGVVGGAKPCERITFLGGGVGRGTIVDGEVERYHAVAVGGIDEGVCCRGVACGVGIAVNPCVGVADGVDIGVSGSPTDCKVERVVGGIGAAFVNLVGRSD